MMNCCVLCFLVPVMCTADTAAVGVQAKLISKEEASRRIQYLMQLLHEVTVSAKLALSPE